MIAIYNTEGDLQCKYNYDAWGNHRIGNARNELIYDSATGVIATGYENHIAILNPIRYRGYYYDTETGLYYLQSRYYDATLCRFLNRDNVNYLEPESIHGLNLYAYCNNNPIGCAANYLNKSKNIMADSFVAPAIFTKVNTRDSAGLSFSVGVVTPEKWQTPSWVSIYAIYVKGKLSFRHSSENGFSLASLEAGIADVTFYTPKLFSSLPENSLMNPNAYFGVGVFNAGLSVGCGFSASIDIASLSAGVQLGDSIRIGVKFYVGVGLSADLSKGFKVGGGLGFGVELTVEIDWYKLLIRLLEG